MRFWGRAGGILRGFSGVSRRSIASGVAAATSAAAVGFVSFAEDAQKSANKPGSGWYMKPWTSFQQEPAFPDKVPGYDRVFVMRRTFYSVNLMGKLRDAESNRSQFVDAARKLSVMLFNEALGMLPHAPRTITTPVDGAKYVTFEMPDPEREVCVVSVLRAASAMAESMTREYPNMPVGTILIQRDEATAQPVLIYSNLPKDVEKRRVILVDPMLATGGSAKSAIAVMRQEGIHEQNIIFCCMVASPEGIDNVMKSYPLVRILVGEVDRGLNDKKYIVPGLGDFGDRFYGTD